MGFGFKKSKNIGGLKLNFSKSGVGISAGVKGFRISAGPKGVNLNAGKNGVYLRKKLNKKSENLINESDNIENDEIIENTETNNVETDFIAEMEKKLFLFGIAFGVVSVVFNSVVMGVLSALSFGFFILLCLLSLIRFLGKK